MWKRRSSIDLRTIKAQRICLIKPSALGDVVQTLPLLPVLRARFPDAEISWVIQSGLSNLLEGHPDLDEIIEFHRQGGSRQFLSLLNTLKQAKFDLVFDLQGLLRTALMTRATKAKLRIGLETAREGSHRVCHRLIPGTSNDVPAHQRYWRVAEELGFPQARPEMSLGLSVMDEQWCRATLDQLPKPLWTVHPGAKWVTKRWPVEKYAALVTRAIRQWGGTAIVVGSPDETELADHFSLHTHRLLPEASLLNLSGKTTLKQLAAVLKRSDFVLTNDSGPMHLAAGMGTPVLGLFTCTSAFRSGPGGDSHVLVSTEVACAASYKKRCPHSGSDHMSCLEELSMERVWSGLRQLVEKHPQRAVA